MCLRNGAGRERGGAQAGRLAHLRRRMRRTACGHTTPTIGCSKPTWRTSGNRRSKGKSTTKRQAEQPGIMPTLYGRHLIGNTIFLGLKDVAADLPEYGEYPIPVRMRPTWRSRTGMWRRNSRTPWPTTSPCLSSTRPAAAQFPSPSRKPFNQDCERLFLFQREAAYKSVDCHVVALHIAQCRALHEIVPRDAEWTLTAQSPIRRGDTGRQPFL